jgi:3' exoribonuclease, RNase T-like
MHIMIDLETMGVRPDAAIVSIGAVHFDQTEVHSQFHVAIQLASCLEHGLTQDQSTVDWWMKQSAAARSSWQGDHAVSLDEGMAMFSVWVRNIGSEKQIKPWGNGADFDLVLLKSAYTALNADPPWRFYNHHCFRTVKNLFPTIGVPRAGTHHNALDDAMHQVQHLQAICKFGGLKLS